MPNDEKVMKSIEDTYNQIKREFNDPSRIHSQFDHMCSQIKKLLLDVTKVEYAKKFRGMFQKLDDFWKNQTNLFDQENDYAEKIRELYNEQFSNFEKIIDRALAEENLNIDKSALNQANKSNKIAIGSLFIAIIALIFAVLAIIIPIFA